jgi:hypothetical protein
MEFEMEDRVLYRRHREVQSPGDKSWHSVKKIGEAWTLACCTFVSPRDDLSSVRHYLHSSQLKPCVSYGLVETLLHSTWK